MCALATKGSSYKHITVKSLHPTFGAEIGGVDFSKPVADEIFDEIRAAARKVGWNSDFLSHLTTLDTAEALGGYCASPSSLLLRRPPSPARF